MVNKFKCGVCNKFTGTRKGLREHMKKEHLIRKQIASIKDVPAKKRRQSWWISEQWI